MKTTSVTCAMGLGLSAVLGCGSNGGTGSDGGGGGDADVDGSAFPEAGGDSAGDASCDDGGTGPGCGCPLYQTACNGKCIPITVDPKNCGGCGVTCAANEVCSAGVCANGCLQGLTACNGACVDLTMDNGNCGVCANQCGPNEGCVDGACKPALVFGPGPGGCVNGGPPIVVDDGKSPICGGKIAATTFTWALCSCTDVTLSSKFTTDGFDSTNMNVGKLGAGVGLDRTFSATSEIDIGGTLWASSNGGLTTSSQARVRSELHVGGNQTSGSVFDVDDDGWVKGDVTGPKITFAKTLYVSPSSQVGNGVQYQTLTKQNFTVAPPCDCTKPLPVDACPRRLLRLEEHERHTLAMQTELRSNGSPAVRSGIDDEWLFDERTVLQPEHRRLGSIEPIWNLRWSR